MSFAFYIPIKFGIFLEELAEIKTKFLMININITTQLAFGKLELLGDFAAFGTFEAC